MAATAAAAKYFFQFFNRLTVEDQQAMFALDLTLKLIHEDMAACTPSPKKYLAHHEEYEHLEELPEASIAVQDQEKVVDAIHELTDVVKDSLKKPRNEFKVYPQAGSTANVGCDQKHSDFKNYLPGADGMGKKSKLESKKSDETNEI